IRLQTPKIARIVLAATSGANTRACRQSSGPSFRSSASKKSRFQIFRRYWTSSPRSTATTINATKDQMVRELRQNPEALRQKRENRLFRSGTDMVCEGTLNYP